MPSQTEIRQQITGRIAAALQQDLIPWRRPWKHGKGGGLPRNLASRRRYQGVNVPLLQLAASDKGHRSNFWGTYRQWRALGGQVRRGEKGTQIVLSKTVEKRAAGRDGGEVEKDRFFLLRTFTVFNLDQVEGEALAPHRSGESQGAEAPDASHPDWEPAERVVTATAADIRFGGDRAFYHRPTGGSWPNHTGGDYIQVPSKSQFPEIRDFFDTIFHELGHWAECRLGWEGPYAMGELVAEMAACYLADEIGVPLSEGMGKHCGYLQHWLRAMQGDPKWLFQAATQAGRVADFILAFSQPAGPGDGHTAAVAGEAEAVLA